MAWCKVNRPHKAVLNLHVLTLCLYQHVLRNYLNLFTSIKTSLSSCCPCSCCSPSVFHKKQQEVSYRLTSSYLSFGPQIFSTDVFRLYSQFYLGSKQRWNRGGAVLSNSTLYHEKKKQFEPWLQLCTLFLTFLWTWWTKSMVNGFYFIFLLTVQNLSWRYSSNHAPSHSVINPHNFNFFLEIHSKVIYPRQNLWHYKTIRWGNNL